MSQYTAGKVRKSRREKELEAAEVKKREEEESAAKAYAEFLDAFEGEDAGKNKTGSNFVKASTESQTAYVPALKHISEGPVRSSRAFNTVSLAINMHGFPRFLPLYAKSPSPPSISAPKPKGKRAMDSFLEEIKRRVYPELSSVHELTIGIQRAGRTGSEILPSR